MHERALHEPLWWFAEVLNVTLYQHQQDVITDILAAYNEPDPEKQRSKAVLASCNSAAKSHTLAALICYWITNMVGSKVITSAPTARQNDQVLWSEIRKMIKGARIPLGGALMPKASEWHFDAEWYAVGLNAQVTEAFQGRKSPRLLIVVDEASGCKEPMFEAMQGNMASGRPLMLLASNPTRATGQVHRAFHAGRNEWFTRRIDAFDLVNLAPFKQEFDDPKTTFARKLQLLRTAPELSKHLATGRWAASLLSEFGEDSDVWRVRVRGLFPKGDPTQLISLGDVADARARWRQINAMERAEAEEAAAKGKQFPWWKFRELLGDKAQGGLDVARYGDCDSVLAAQALLTSMPHRTWGQQSTTNLSGFVRDAIEELQLHQTNVDEPGVGGGPVDQLDGMVAGIVPFNGGRRAWNPTRFANLRSEQFWHLRMLLQKGLPALPDCDLTEGQLTAIRYSYLPTGERRVETKEEMAARGVHKMDHADAEMMAYANVPGADALTTGRDTLVPLEY